MTGWQRFWIGGGGALLPVMVTAIQSDLPGIIDYANDYTVGTWLGTGLRYLIMLIVGGAGAAIHPDENHPLKLVQLGIGAPALFASFVVAQPGPKGDVTPPIKQTKAESISFRIAANAAEMNEPGKTIILSQGIKKSRGRRGCCGS